MTEYIKQHPLVTFFLIAYGFSWGSYFLLSGPVLFPFGAIISALIVASITRGIEGLKDLFSRCLKWRVGVRWYLAAFLIPVFIALIIVFLNILLGAPSPTSEQLALWYNIFLFFPMVMIDAPLWEDSGWRGFAVPIFPANRSRFLNTLILGLLLAGWHLPIALRESSLTVPYLLATVASAFVTNWVYFRARESALIAILYHTSANTMGLFFAPMFTGTDLVRFYWLLGAVNCIFAIIVQLIPSNEKD